MLKERKTDNFSMRIYLETIQSIVGAHGLKSVLNYAHLEKYIDNFPPLDGSLEIPLGDLQDLYRSLLELFGQKGIRSLQMQVGEQIIRKSLETHPWFIRLLVPLRFLAPERSRLKIGLKFLIWNVNRRYPPSYDSQESRLELKEEDCFVIIFRDNWESEDVLSQSPVCHATVGSVKMFAEWTTGHFYDVKEVECRAMGHPADVFEISKSYQKNKGKAEKRSLDSPHSQKKYV
ncbi:MAG: hypothetical protein HXS44_15685 [Theionarchaea archaeon]|nr:hypothetical protein [Theionarchaea archaeon]